MCDGQGQSALRRLQRQQTLYVAYRRQIERINDWSCSDIREIRHSYWGQLLLGGHQVT